MKLPLQLGGNSTAELIKRGLPSDDEILSTSRYQTKAQIRILLDDETAGSGASNVAGIPAGKGVLLSAFDPIPLNGGNALRNVSDLGSFTQPNFKQINPDSSISDAMTVRGIKNAGATVAGNYIPPGSGVNGRILIEVVKPDGTTLDVTTAILSMGMTQGEPNGIVYLQRPLFTSFLQGSRDRAGNGLDLVNLTKNYRFLADGEIAVDPTGYLDSLGFLDTTIAILDDDTSPTSTRAATPSTWFENVVPINVYNVREGWYRNDLDENNIYERGMTSVVEINMHNLARWVDGIYNANLLAGTNAVSTNIKNPDEGYVVYVSDRRGDKVKTEYLKDATAFLSTNGIVDNEDIYGPNSALDEGEDVIDFGWDSAFGGASKKGILQKDISELPDTGNTWTKFRIVARSNQNRDGLE